MKMLLRCGGCVLMIAAAIGCWSGGQAAAAAGQANSPAQTYVRPTPPTRDPHTAGYVEAKELPDEFLTRVKNFKIRGSSGKLNIALDATQQQVEAIVLADETVKKWLDGNTPKKVIYVKNKMINVVV